MDQLTPIPLLQDSGCTTIRELKKLIREHKDLLHANKSDKSCKRCICQDFFIILPLTDVKDYNGNSFTVTFKVLRYAICKHCHYLNLDYVMSFDVGVSPTTTLDYRWLSQYGKDVIASTNPELIIPNQTYYIISGTSSSWYQMWNASKFIE